MNRNQWIRKRKINRKEFTEPKPFFNTNETHKLRQADRGGSRRGEDSLLAGAPPSAQKTPENPQKIYWNN